MSEERGSGRERKGRRRYFRPRQERDASQPPSPAPKPAEDKAPVGRVRKARRRSRSRQRFADENRSSTAVDNDIAYVPPQSVFVYTYSVHPELRDTYEFRPEHFSRVGRKLEDYDIDLSKLFPGGATGPDGMPLMIETMTTPEYHWEEWEE